LSENFYTILTAIGKSKLANSAVLGSKVNFNTLKVGDGNGTYYEPSEDQTSLINKVWEGNINSISIDESNSNWIVIETIIPATDGGFFIREAGIFDEDEDLIAVSKISETYKPIISEGSTKDVSIKIVLEVSNVDSITLKIDPNVIVATKKDIQVLESKVQGVNEQLSEMEQQQKTYSELATMVSNNQLVAGTQYVLTDYATKYQQPDTLTIKTMAIERLVLTAISGNKFDTKCSSLDYPNDVIEYAFSLKVCEDGTTPRNGFILRRSIHTQNTLIDVPLDWRTILWARWRPDPNNYLLGTVTTPYSVWTSGAPELNKIYKAGSSLYIAVNTNTPTSATDTNVFQKVYDDITVGMLLNSNLSIGSTGSVDIILIKGDLHERPTFGTGCDRIKIGNSPFGTYSNTNYLFNIVFGNSCAVITIKDNSHHLTFATGNANLEIGNNCYSVWYLVGSTIGFLGENCCNNVFAGVNNNNFFAINCYGNRFLGTNGGNNFGPDCWGNTFCGSCNSNVFTAACHGNFFRQGCVSNCLSSNCANNNFGASCYNNTMGANCNGNTLGTNCCHNTFGSSCWGNNIGTDYISNTHGSAFYQNTIGNGCSYNNFAGQNYNNNIGASCVANYFGPDVYSTTFGSGCNANSIGVNAWGNTFAANCVYNFIESACYQNSFGQGCQGNHLSAYSPNNTLGDNCCYNDFGTNCHHSTFGTTCTGNFLGPTSQYNTMGNNKKWLHIKLMVGKNISGVTVLESRGYSTNIEARADGTAVYWALNASNVPVYTVIA